MNYNTHLSDYKSNIYIRLNKYISNSGYCSRRKADVLIQNSAVKVNGKVTTELGHKVLSSDTVTINDKLIELPSQKIYILLNKPSDCITSVKDQFNRKIVTDFIPNKYKSGIFPVGRLDRNTTGALLLTNDGELTYKLTHPSFNITKEYLVKLNSTLKKNDYSLLLNGITLNDGISKFDSLSFPDHNDRSKVIVNLHSGKNRIIRRTFEKLSYEVKSLKRTSFAGLKISNIHPGSWRFLMDHEITQLFKIISTIIIVFSL